MFGKKIKSEFKVEGMHCSHCAAKVETAIKAIDGVKSVKADPIAKNVVIISSETIDSALVAEAVKGAGFTFVG